MLSDTQEEMIIYQSYLDSNTKEETDMPGENNQPEQIQFIKKVWKQGKRLVIGIPRLQAKFHELEGKYVKVTLEVVEID